MTKKKYSSPIMVFNETLDPDDDPTIIIGPSQGTSGDVSQFTWDTRIDPDFIDLFWLSYDETDLEMIDTDHDLFISYEEFMDWYNSELPW